MGPPGGGPGSLTASREQRFPLSEPQCGTPQRLPLKSPLARGKHRPRLTATAEKQLFTLEKQNRLKQQEAAGSHRGLARALCRPARLGPPSACFWDPIWGEPASEELAPGAPCWVADAADCTGQKSCSDLGTLAGTPAAQAVSREPGVPSGRTLGALPASKDTDTLALNSPNFLCVTDMNS